METGMEKPSGAFAFKQNGRDATCVCFRRPERLQKPGGMESYGHLWPKHTRKFHWSQMRSLPRSHKGDSTRSGPLQALL